MLPTITNMFRINNMELKYTSTQSAIIKLSVVCSEKYKDKEDTLWIDATAFGKQAEAINTYFNEKDRIIISGKLKYETWTDQQGQKHSKHSLLIEKFDFVEKKSSYEPKPVLGQAPQGQQSYDGIHNHSESKNGDSTPAYENIPKDDSTDYTPKQGLMDYEIDEDEIPFNEAK